MKQQYLFVLIPASDLYRRLSLTAQYVFLATICPTVYFMYTPFPPQKTPRSAFRNAQFSSARGIIISLRRSSAAQEDYVIKAMSRKWENKWSFRLKSISLDLHLFIYSDTSGGGGVELVLFRQGLSKISFAKNVLFYARRIHTSDHTNRGDLGSCHATMRLLCNLKSLMETHGGSIFEWFQNIFKKNTASPTCTAS